MASNFSRIQIAKYVPYDGSLSGLAATNVQDAIDSLSTSAASLPLDVITANYVVPNGAQWVIFQRGTININGRLVINGRGRIL